MVWGIALIACLMALLGPAEGLGAGIGLAALALSGLVNTPLRERLWLLFAVASPLLFAGAVLIAWVAAWLALGHPPRPSLDDPKSIGTPVRIAVGMTYFFLVLVPAGIVGSIALPLVLVASRSDESKRRRGLEIAVFIALAILAHSFCWVCADRLLHGTRTRAIDWLMD
jgi:hypothetical protein